jgi:hypothetical protein
MINEDRTEDKSGTLRTERKTITRRAQRSEEVTKVLEGSCLLVPGIACNAPAGVVWRDELFQGIKVGFSNLRDLL